MAISNEGKKKNLIKTILSTFFSWYFSCHNICFFYIDFDSVKVEYMCSVWGIIDGHFLSAFIDDVYKHNDEVCNV